jgi:hypothetical protein
LGHHRRSQVQQLLGEPKAGKTRRLSKESIAFQRNSQTTDDTYLVPAVK